MNSVAVCIPTYQRPEMLKILIKSIIGCNIDSSLIRSINITVVDNDEGRSAEAITEELRQKFTDKWTIRYFSFPVKGLSNVRNEMLIRGLETDPDFLVFVDDDEYVTPEWLNELVKTISANNGDLVMGPVNSLVNKNLSRYISCWLEREDYRNNTKLNFIRTGNLIMSSKSLRKHKIKFDPRFNKTGGEDSYFGVQMIKAGATIYWAAKAIVYETVSEKRTNFNWLVRRYYNGANIFTYILKIEKKYLKLIKKILVSFLYVIIGICGMVLVPVPFEKRYWGPLKISEGIGAMAGLMSIRYNEYK